MTDNENTNDNFDNIPNQPIFWGMSENTYCMLMNLIQVLPGWGYVLTILMWVMNKDGSPQIDKFGKNATNWIISIVIYWITAGVINFFVFIVLAIISAIAEAPLFIFTYLFSALFFTVLGAIAIVFPIIAAVKANKGVYWKYPLSIQFFK
ncbi:MAG: DUF4870 domain-containing protein [Planctomycetaceae bacterium]|jgi:uncharacterized Tic20 family protein|nr:DUF4870 domain-containing protein [Planctomycetaceae bacterium]